MPYEEEAAGQPGKIKVVCHGCGARYQVRDSKVRGRRFRATCKRCGGIIVARAANTEASQVVGGGPPGPLVSGPQRPSGTHSVPGEDLQSEEACWYVVIAGKPHGPLSPNQVRKFFESGRINGRTYFWRAGDPEWRRLLDLEEFRDLFAEGATSFYGTPAPGQAALPGGDEFDHEEPTDISDPETVAAAIRGQAFAEQRAPDDYADASEDSYDGETGYHRVESDEEESATRMVQRNAVMGAEAIPAHALPPLPLVPRRRAALPAPSGMPRRPDLLTSQPLAPRPAAGGAPPPSVPLPSAAAVAAPPAAGMAASAGLAPLPAPGAPPGFAATLPFPGGAPPPGPAGPGTGLGIAPLPAPPGAAIGSTAPLPRLSAPVAEPFEPSRIASLPSANPPARPGAGVLAPSLLPATGTAGSSTRAMLPAFWTTGKIIATAMIGGGLLVAATIVVVVRVMAPKSRSGPQVAVAQDVDIKVRPPAPAPRPAAKAAGKAARPRREAARRGHGAAPARAAAASRPPAIAERPQDASRANSPSAARVKLKKVARKPAHPAGKGELAEADALLAAAATESKAPKKKAAKASGTPKVDVDDILAAGGGGEPKPAKKAPKKAAVNADDILAAGTGGSSGLPSRPPRARMEEAMRSAGPSVQACHRKFAQAGVADVVVTLRGDGTHTQRVVGALANTPTAACVNQAVAGAAFPRFSGPPMVFKWRYTLP